LWRETGVPSIAVAVARDQKLLFSDGIGYADLESLSRAGPTTVYNIGSISKVMAAVAVLQLVERGEVSLDDPIQKYLPAFPDKGTPITLRHLMTHTSGIRHYRPDDFPGEPWADNVATYDSIEAAVEIFEDDPLLFAPGEYYRYSSYAVNLLQGVVEAASGLGFEVYMRRRVWAPAGMLSSSFDLPERIVTGRARGYEIVDGEVVNYYPNENVTYKFAGGGMLSTVEDLVRFGVAITNHRLLGEEISTEMLEPQLDDIQVFEGEDPPSDLRWEQALMWRIRRDEADRPYLHHCGQVKGFNACLIIYRDEDLIVAIIDNGSGGAADLRGARGFAEIFRREEGGESLE
jgi:CubicO group peptidase (beta-lactamase class C family)